jgi:phosphotransferase system enzyme I (PtsP)
MRERVDDIKGLAQRVLAYLQKNERSLPQYSEKSILIGDMLTPADLAEVPEGCLSGVICARGSSNSHVAILARAMKVPTVMGIGDAPIYDLQDKQIIIDGYYGQVYVSPSPTLREEFDKLLVEEQKLDAALDEIRELPAETVDGHIINLMVNTGLGADISFALASGAEGVGLYRTEIPFMMRDRFPSTEEQRIIYRQLLASFAPRPVILRTLDVGGDKPLPYFPIVEDNPFLGWRGIRITLDHPEIFLSQIRAMLRASEGLNNMRIMLPMVTDVSEIDEAMRLMRKAFVEVHDEGYEIEMPQVGVMIEVPSAAYQARALAKRVDFLSVGSNDLTQYLLAVDRNNSRVAGLYDSLHPAVLRALIQIVEGGHQEGKHVSICGELAGDPAAVMLLLAMGFDSLSMNASSVGRVKWIVRHVAKKKAAKLLQEVLSMESAVMIRCHMELALERAGLGNLIRAGR